MSVARVFQSIFIVFAHAATAVVHLWWNDLAKTAITLVRLCLASPAVGILQGIATLHMLVLLSFAIALAFRVTSAQQTPISRTDHKAALNFDNIETSQGWADVPSNYSFLDFQDFLIFKPSDPELEGLISKHDLNCAASKPNALYGARPGPLSEIPTVRLNATRCGTWRTFTLRSLKIKPLDMPLSYAKVNLRGLKLDNTTILWNVDFPAGFHDILHVELKSFSNDTWDELVRLEIWSDFYHAGSTMDWEFCVDDMAVSFQE